VFALRVDDELEIVIAEERHAAEVHALVNRNRDYLREWMPWLDTSTSPAQTAEFFRGALQDFAAGKGFNGLLRFRGETVGSMGLRVNPESHSAELGYWVSEDRQGHGIVTRAAAALITAAFDELGLHRVEIRCATANGKSRAIPERLGLHHEGTKRDAEWLYDHYVDHEIYSVLANEWTPPPPSNG
jgi:ribosomal-protein-serine acetyltransferase